MSSLLEINQLTVELPTAQGWVRPVNEVSLCIGAGERVGLMGTEPSACARFPPPLRRSPPIHFQPIQ